MLCRVSVGRIYDLYFTVIILSRIVLYYQIVIIFLICLKSLRDRSFLSIERKSHLALNKDQEIEIEENKVNKHGKDIWSHKG